MAKIYQGESYLKHRRNIGYINFIISFIIIILYFIAADFFNITKIFGLWGYIPLVLAVIGANYYLSSAQTAAAGYSGEKRAIKLVENLSDEYSVFSNVFIKTDTMSTRLDMVIVHKKGVFLIEVKNHKGLIRGDQEKKKWKHTKITSQGTLYLDNFPNPIPALNNQVEALSDYFKYQDIDVNIEGALLFTHRFCWLRAKKVTTPVFNSKRGRFIEYITNHSIDQHIDADTLNKIYQSLEKNQAAKA